MSGIEEAFRDWMDVPGAMNGGLQGAFTAGAAWMAAQFANGAPLKIGPTPRKYKFSYYIGWSQGIDPEKASTAEIVAYSDEEAERSLRACVKWKAYRSGGDSEMPIWIEKCEPI